MSYEYAVPPSTGQGHVLFTEDSFRDFKHTVQKSRKQGRQQFTWDGREFLTAYAEYLIQYVEMQIKKKGR